MRRAWRNGRGRPTPSSSAAGRRPPPPRGRAHTAPASPAGGRQGAGHTQRLAGSQEGAQRREWCEYGAARDAGDAGVGWVAACQSHGRRVMRNSPLCVRPVAHRASSLNGVRSSLRPPPTAQQQPAWWCSKSGSRRRAGVLVQAASARTCSLGLSCCSCSFLTSRAKTASGGAVESMHDALMEMTKLPPFFRKYWALRPTMRACRGAGGGGRGGGRREGRGWISQQQQVGGRRQTGRQGRQELDPPTGS